MILRLGFVLQRLDATAVEGFKTAGFTIRSGGNVENGYDGTRYRDRETSQIITSSTKLKMSLKDLT